MPRGDTKDKEKSRSSNTDGGRGNKNTGQDGAKKRSGTTNNKSGGSNKSSSTSRGKSSNQSSTRGGSQAKSNSISRSNSKRSVGSYVGARRAEAAKKGWETRRRNQKNKKKAA